MSKNKNNISKDNPRPWEKKPHLTPETERPEPLRVVPEPLPLNTAFLERMHDEGMTVPKVTERIERFRAKPAMSEEVCERLSRGGEAVPFTAPVYTETHLEAVADELILKAKTQRPLNACPHWPGPKDGTCTGWCS